MISGSARRVHWHRRRGLALVLVDIPLHVMIGDLPAPLRFESQGGSLAGRLQGLCAQLSEEQLEPPGGRPANQRGRLIHRSQLKSKLQVPTPASGESGPFAL
jgi:hypothetical protein